MSFERHVRVHLLGFPLYMHVWQVEEFLLMPVEEALNTIKTDLARWKPNCALVMIDFALRHGFLDPDHPVRGTERTATNSQLVCNSGSIFT